MLMTFCRNNALCIHRNGDVIDNRNTHMHTHIHIHIHSNTNIVHQKQLKINSLKSLSNCILNMTYQSKLIVSNSSSTPDLLFFFCYIFTPSTYVNILLAFPTRFQFHHGWPVFKSLLFFFNYGHFVFYQFIFCSWMELMAGIVKTLYN